jgi:hypothetical protein
MKIRWRLETERTFGVRRRKRRRLGRKWATTDREKKRGVKRGRRVEGLPTGSCTPWSSVLLSYSTGDLHVSTKPRPHAGQSRTKLPVPMPAPISRKEQLGCFPINIVENIQVILD